MRPTNLVKLMKKTKTHGEKQVIAKEYQERHNSSHMESQLNQS